MKLSRSDSRDAVLATIRARARFVKPARRRMPRQAQPDGLRLDYARQLVGIVSMVRDIVEDETSGLSRLFVVRSDAVDINASLDRAAKRVAERLRPSELQSVAAKIGEKTSDFQKAQLARQAQAALGVDISSLMPAASKVVDAFVSENVALIKSIPTTYLSEVEKTLTRGLSAGERWETTAEKLAERFGVAESRARLIARDQVGKLYGQLNAERQKGLGVTGYIWQTANDGRVRDEHEARQGERYEWSAPPEDGHPGEPVNCRCFAEPDFTAIFEELRG